MSNLKLTIDLLPKGAWGNNLRERLSKKDWDTLRNICYEKAKHCCTICGKKDEQLEAHEVWAFDIESKTQTLKDIVALCTACHGVKHIRNSERIGYGESAKAHFLKINQCALLVFAKHYTEAMFLFDKRNKILRWKLIADLNKFGGKGMEVKKRIIPLIINPYENIDFETVKHVRIANHSEIELSPEWEAETIILQPFENAGSQKLSESQESAVYFVTHKPNSLPPKIRSIAVDNYSGTITVDSDRVNKIQWIFGDKIIKSKYNFAGKFTTNFSVENLDDSEIRFLLIGADGETISQAFTLIRAS